MEEERKYLLRDRESNGRNPSKDRTREKSLDENSPYILSSTWVSNYHNKDISATYDGIIAIGDEIIGEIAIIDINDNTATRKFETNCPIYTLAISADALKVVVLNLDCNITVWNTQFDFCKGKVSYGALLHTFDDAVCQEIEVLLPDNSGKKVISYTSSGRVYIFHLDTYTVEYLEIACGTIRCASISLDDKILILSHHDGSITMHDIISGTLLSTHQMPYHIDVIKPMACSPLLLIGNPFRVVVWDIVKATETLIFHTVEQESKLDVAIDSKSGGAFVVFHPRHDSIRIRYANGYVTHIGCKRIKIILMRFTRDDKLITFDGYAIRIYDADFHPFWTIAKHHKFDGYTKNSLKILFISNRVKREKRKRSYITQIPRDVLLYIFSFIQRDY